MKVLKWFAIMFVTWLAIKVVFALLTPTIHEQAKKSVQRQKEDVMAGCAEHAKSVVAPARLAALASCVREQGFTVSNETLAAFKQELYDQCFNLPTQNEFRTCIRRNGL